MSSGVAGNGLGTGVLRVRDGHGPGPAPRPAFPVDDGADPAPERLRLLTSDPVRPTPAGAFRAVSRPDPGPVGRLLLELLRSPVTPDLSMPALRAWTGCDDDQEALTLLLAAQEDALVETIPAPLALPEGSLEELMPPLLESLSAEGRALLADADGFPVWVSGLDATFAGRLAALSADVASLHERHAATIGDVLGEESSAWALVDGVGASRIGCWPLHVGDTRFVLVAQGLPRMHHPNFTTLVWLLVYRYGS